MSVPVERIREVIAELRQLKQDAILMNASSNATIKREGYGRYVELKNAISLLESVVNEHVREP